jgi:hypothetical protein
MKFLNYAIKDAALLYYEYEKTPVIKTTHTSTTPKYN